MNVRSSRMSDQRLHTNLVAERDIVIRYKQEQLYDVVADVASYPQFLPFCMGSRLLRPVSHLTGTTPFVMEAELTVGFLSFHESYVSQVTCHPYHSVEVYFNCAINQWFYPTRTRQSLHRPRPCSKPLQQHGDSSQHHCILIPRATHCSLTTRVVKSNQPL